MVRLLLAHGAAEELDLHTLDGIIQRATSKQVPEWRALVVNLPQCNRIPLFFWRRCTCATRLCLLAPRGYFALHDSDCCYTERRRRGGVRQLADAVLNCEAYRCKLAAEVAMDAMAEELVEEAVGQARSCRHGSKVSCCGALPIPAVASQISRRNAEHTSGTRRETQPSLPIQLGWLPRAQPNTAPAGRSPPDSVRAPCREMPS